MSKENGGVPMNEISSGKIGRSRKGTKEMASSEEGGKVHLEL